MRTASEIRERKFEEVTGESWGVVVAFADIAGGTLAQTADMYVSDHTDTLQSDWADAIGVAQSAVSINANLAREKLHGGWP